MLIENPVSRTDNLVIQEFKDEILIYDLKINKAFCLNQTAALVWQLCNGSNSITEIAGLMPFKLKTTLTEELVRLALDQLKRDNLLEKSGEIQIDFGGLSRRQLIRKVGLASMVVLPFVSSVVAPNALMAQSGTGLLALFSPCESGSQCATGVCADTFFPGNGPRCCQALSLAGPARLPGEAFCVFAAEACTSLVPTICCSGVGGPAIPNPLCFPTGTELSCPCF